MSKKIAAIIGMHRSGTSVLSRCMKIFGAQLGDRIILPGPDNPKGYWEDEDILNLDIEMLTFLNTSWDSVKTINNNDILNLTNNGYIEKAKDILQQKLRNSDFFAIKDPRMAKLLPIWKHAFTESADQTIYIIAIRNPISVINSLKKRNNIDPVTASFIWLSHVIPSLIVTENEPRLIIDYDSFIDNPEKQINRISKKFGLTINKEEEKNFINEFLDKNLRNSFIKKEEFYKKDNAFFLCKEIYTFLILEKNNEINLKNLANLWNNAFEKMEPAINILDKYILENKEKDIKIKEKDIKIKEKDIKIKENECTILDLRNEIDLQKNNLIKLYSEILKKEKINEVIKITGKEINAIKENIKCIYKRIDQNNFFILSLWKSNKLNRNLFYILKCKDIKIINNSGLFNYLWYSAQINSGLLFTQNELLLHYITIGERIGFSPQPLFDSKWYREKNPDINIYSKSSLLHYIIHGESEGRNPCLYFFPHWYYANNSDLLGKEINLLYHYIYYGEKEGRRPNPYFFPQWYLKKYPDVAQSGCSPLAHYQQYGGHEERLPCPLFLPKWYRHEYLDNNQDDIYPLYHFIEYGEHENKKPNPYFWTDWYRKEYCPDTKKDFRPLEDYLINGENIDRRPNPYFFPKWYLENNPDVAEAKMSPLHHFIQNGADEGRDPGPFFDSLWYRTEYPQIESSGLMPFVHYAKIGIYNNFAPFDIPSRNRTLVPITPHYFNTITYKKSHKIIKKIAVHLHLYNLNDIYCCLDYINAIKSPFDLILSLASPSYYNCEYNTTLHDFAKIEKNLYGKIFNIVNISIHIVPPKGHGVAPLLIIFKKIYKKYDIIGHFSYKKNCDTEYLLLQESIFTNLLGKAEEEFNRTSYIFNMMEGKVSFVFSKNKHDIIKNKNEWMGNFYLSEKLLNNIFNIDINDFRYTSFIYPLMFWAKSSIIENIVKISLSYENFPDNRLNFSETITSSMGNIVPILSSISNNKVVQLIDGIDSIQNYQFYENQIDYSKEIVHKYIKILSLYLPQFHRTPENDLWHGKGFTEWTKVRSSNPLYNGHYQQHIPHEDIGYYELVSPDILKKQFTMMKKSGVYGQIFYHYWFNGKLILESPVKMLLDNKDIEMPFCFCWANENWTKRWDGDEENILLQQIYSPEDAKNFIKYLIPFFMDKRYIKIDNTRPLLFIYRPNSIPNSQEYINIWNQECLRMGIDSPYIVATLTRGATSPHDFGMDAGVERILHDWAGGNLVNMKDYMQFYEKFDGNILLFDHVIDYYIQNNKQKRDFTYFQSIVPTWDNTARYGKDAYILHGSTPEKFQYWLEEIISMTQKNLDINRQFIVVNAWNEWAEGDHLEPDTRFGYAYLNSIGRALSDISYPINFNPNFVIIKKILVHIIFSDELLRVAPDYKEWFINFSKILNRLLDTFPNIYIDSNEEGHIDINILRNNDIKTTYEYEFNLKIGKFFHSDFSIIEKLIQSALKFDGFAIIPNTYGYNIDIASCTSRGNAEPYCLYDAAMILYPKDWQNDFRKPTKLRTDAFTVCTSQPSQHSLENETVTTIIRFHKNGSFDELERALISLQAMEKCIVSPYLAAQDLNEEQKLTLQNLTNRLYKDYPTTPYIQYYTSPDGKGDLRSQMLNESICNIKTRFAAFLDYDDILMPNAYHWLIERLKQTNMAIAFARVYLTLYNSKTGQIIKRYRYFNSGKNYDDFFKSNFAPIHSFMLDTGKLNFNNLLYRNDHKYMEDYCLLLQLAKNNNTDWKGVEDNYYIGDYMHATDRDQTLAFFNKDKKLDKLSDPDYIRDDLFIQDIKRMVGQNLI